ncbi:EDD domain protein, DegV family [Marininema mesophilum]|uniref:EDD domain protein, DegV family n=1 Tax=Marininema mesophilum TaxID=1048340 RepID=A0A1H2R983_9BACL|nr:DegV family protein [Marininema mesophilum]SDW15992.1 EDD domain protein, DegV family [Marininema mesophilum]
MNKIALVTDSSCDLPIQILRKFDIESVSLRVIYKNEEFRDGVDIQPTEVYERLETEVPKTSMPSPQDIKDTFYRLKEQGYTHCIVMVVSSHLSGTYNNFRLMAEDFEGMKIDVIDSKGLSWILGYMVLEAARSIRAKMDYTEILKRIEEARKRVRGYFVLDTLDYLKAGGRIGKVTATLGTMLNLKPIITLDDHGGFIPFNVGRGKKQAVKKMLEHVTKQLQTTKANIAILQGRAEKEAEALKEKLKDIENVCELTISAISPALVVHTGPGLVGLVVDPIVHEKKYE